MARIMITGIEDVRKGKNDVRISTFGGLVTIRDLLKRLGFEQLLKGSGIVRRRKDAIEAEDLALLTQVTPKYPHTSQIMGKY